MAGNANSGRQPDALTLLQGNSMDARLTVEALDGLTAPLQDLVNALRQVAGHARDAQARSDGAVVIELDRRRAAREAAATTYPAAA